MRKNENDVSGKFSTITFPCFTQEQVKEINKKIKENILQEQDPSDAASNVAKIGKFFNVDCLPLMELIHPWLYQCQHINKEVFGYNIHWDFHLDYLNYNVYVKNGGYEWHIDEKPARFDMKLTCLLNLSEEPYEGGKFCAINSQEEIKFDSGMGLVLNSLIAHKVTPVTKGERITLTYWATGPSWR